MVTVPYYSQHVGRANYCLPTSIAMVADRYGRLPDDVSGTPDRAPKFVVDVGYGFAKRRIADLNEQQFTPLWEEIGTDPLGGLIWDVFAPNGRDLAALRAVRFELASVRRMTRGDGGLPRGDCFMVPGPSRQ